MDTENTCNVLGLIKEKQPNLWNEYLKTASKQTVENIMKSESIKLRNTLWQITVVFDSATTSKKI